MNCNSPQYAPRTGRFRQRAQVLDDPPAPGDLLTNAAIGQNNSLSDVPRLPVENLGTLTATPTNLALRLVAANRHRTKPCFVGPAGNMSYPQFDREVRRTASALTLLGVTPGERVIIALDDDLELAVIFLACFAMGALPVVLNPNLDIEPLLHVMRNCRPTLVFGKQARAATLQVACRRLESHLPLLFADGAGHSSWRPAEADPEWNAYVYQDPDQPACIQYTSGTTGNSNGVVHSTAGILAACEQFAERQLGLTDQDVLYSVPKSFFGYGMGNSLFFPLWLGATSVLDPRWPTAETVIHNLKAYRPTALFAVPTLYRMLLDSPLRQEDCTVRLAFSAGAPLSEVIARAWQSRFGVPLHDGIGATELCHVFATTYPDARRPGSVGRMVSDWQASIIGADGLPVAQGEIGVLVVRSSAQALGYWDRPEETAKKFIDPRLGVGWYRTGDLFSRDDSGHLYFHGREDDRFKVYGRWVMPTDVENLLAQHAPELGEVYLVSGCDDKGEQRPILFLRPSGPDSFDATVERVAALLAIHLESYQRPALYLLLEDTPTTSNGKPNRRALGARASKALVGPATTKAKQEA